jgi:hypothetical protein
VSKATADAAKSKLRFDYFIMEYVAKPYSWDMEA